MFAFFKNWRRRRILDRHRIPDTTWEAITRGLPATAHLSTADKDRLRDLASLFLYEKAIEPARGMTVSEAMQVRIACEAVIPVLNLGLDLYRPWYSVIVYPVAFVARDVYRDEAGVIHSGPEARAGEAWERGPVILSWEDIAAARQGYNVIIHEMAHKLDLLDGVANGFPPMHTGMRQEDWTATFSAAYNDLLEQVAADGATTLDPYAATSPAEFFAVASEAFFETPRVLQRAWPDVYGQLALYYRQRP